MYLPLFICLFDSLTHPWQKPDWLWISVNGGLDSNSTTESNLLAHKSWNKRAPAHCYFHCEWCVCVCVCPAVDLWPIRRRVPLSPHDAEIGFSTPDALIRNKWWLRSVRGQTIRSSDVWSDTVLLKRHGGWRIIPESQMFWNEGAESTYCCWADCVQLSGGKGWCLDPRFHFRGFEVSSEVFP